MEKHEPVIVRSFALEGLEDYLALFRRKRVDARLRIGDRKRFEESPIKQVGFDMALDPGIA
jgi:hypothetical protein